VPVLAGGVILGVISAYSSKVNAFSDEHARVVEAVSGQAARFLGRPKTALAGADDSRIDALTGVFAPGVLEEDILSLFGRPSDCCGRVELFLIDISDLASINVTHGKKAGDLVLRLTAESLRRSLPTEAVICRLGGDEFLCLLRSTSDIGTFVERLTKCIRDAGHETGISFGVSVARLSLLPESGRAILEAVKAIRTQAIPLASDGPRFQPGVH
ncbi:MAG: GGDEF domain-containing protein, partial [Acidobacteria bacterium]|nr:GGDEF domain-containing protein [Acidobacteriota bacterium]